MLVPLVAPVILVIAWWFVGGVLVILGCDSCFKFVDLSSLFLFCGGCAACCFSFVCLLT